MLAPYKWLQDYVKIDCDPQTLADKMVMIGNGVEAVHTQGEHMKKVVVGRIDKLEKHPDADRLQICQIDVGGETLQIVTGATNVFEGALVPVALCGSELPNGLKIKKGKLRGVESLGMLCSGEELCIKEADYPGAEVDGILILQDGLVPGTDMRDVLMLNDTVIEFEVGANRPDCLSIIGVAREAAAALAQPIQLPDPAFAEGGGCIQDVVRVRVDAPELCPRYMARAVANVKIEPSPKWMQERIKAAGVRPINNIVDITNFVMLETGQPMHAFDAADIRGGQIIVRRAAEGETMTTLDGKERTFNESMLMIADAEGAIGIAGVMGGENSEIKPGTQTVVFEAAKFMYANIRQTSRGLGLATESSMRFSKEVDIVNVEYALHRACQLVEQLGAGEIMHGEIDLLAVPLEQKTVELAAADVNRLLGTELMPFEMKECLERAFIRTETQGDRLICAIPHFRGDIDGKADIAEEVARIYGYDNLPSHELRGRMQRGGTAGYAREMARDQLRYNAVILGYFECISYSFAGEAQWDKLCLPAGHPLRQAVKILNPLGDDSAYLRTTLVGSMLETLALNLKRKNKGVRLFEISRVFRPRELPLKELPEEKNMLVLGATAADQEDFFTLKAAVEKLLRSMHIRKEVDYEADGEPYMHPGRCARMYMDGRQIGELGEIHPDVQKNFGLPARAYVAQLDLDALRTLIIQHVRFTALHKYPALERDIAVLVDAAAQSGVIRKAILQEGGKYLEAVNLFDVYAGEQLGENKKSLAYSLSFRSKEGTLTDEQIAADMKRILDALADRFGASLRE